VHSTLLVHVEENGVNRILFLYYFICFRALSVVHRDSTNNMKVLAITVLILFTQSRSVSRKFYIIAKL